MFKRLKTLAISFMLLFTLIPTDIVFAWSTEDFNYAILTEPINEDDLIPVELDRVVDGDTAYFTSKSEAKIKTRFLLIDTPEMRGRGGKQPYAQEATDRLEQLLTKANQIYIEYDIGAKEDRYQRDLVYVWVDGILVQEILVSEGLADVAYIYPPNTRYLSQLESSKAYAQGQRVGLWSLDLTSEESSSNLNQTVEEPSEPPVEEDTTDVATQTVYIAPQSGKRYHLSPNCRGLKSANSIVEVSIEEAQARGLTLCGYEK